MEGSHTIVLTEASREFKGKRKPVRFFLVLLVLLIVTIIELCSQISRFKNDNEFAFVAQETGGSGFFEVDSKSFKLDPFLNKPLLIVSTRFFNVRIDGTYSDKSILPVPCEWTHDWSLANISDAAVYHIPQYSKRPPPIPSISVAWSLEGPHYYSRLNDLSDFTLTMTYRNDSDIFEPYMRYGFYDTPYPPKPFNTLIKGAAMLISNCDSRNKRLELAAAISKHIPVYSYGRCLRNTPWPDNVDSKDSISVIGKHVFHLAFENGHSDQYVTEKIQLGFKSGVIPVYYGTRGVFEYIPEPDAIIFADDFKDFDEVGKYMKKVLEDVDLYNKHQAWRSKPIPDWLPKKIQSTKYDYKERLCRKVYEMTRLGGKSLPPIA